MPWSGRAPLMASLDLVAYRQVVRNHFGSLKLEEDLDATSSDMGKVLEGGELEEEELERLRRSYLDQSPRSILEVVRDPALGRLVVLGDPGSGKTLLLRYLLLEWAEGLAPEKEEARLPLLIELRDYALRRHKGEVRSFLDYLHHAQSLRCHLEAKSVDHWLRHHPGRVFFDGLDEIFAADLRQEVQTAIARFADDYPSTQIIGTSRVIGFKHQSWHAEGFRQFMLQELDDDGHPESHPGVAP